jgi:hypothetical protein
MKGILFTEPMFRAVIEGRKTQTRRLGGLDYINDQEDATLKGWETDPEVVPANDESKTINWKGIFPIFKTPNGHFDECYVRPRYQTGEIVYLKEPYQIWREAILYKYLNDDPVLKCKKWKNKLFMPAANARYFIRIKDVRVERLLDISEDDVKKEGIHEEPCSVSGRIWYEKHISEKEAKYEGLFTESALECYQTLWNKINGKDSWDKNPWVFAYTFELTEQPETLNL